MCALTPSRHCLPGNQNSFAYQIDANKHMRHALRLARRALGRAAPNPAVGCVIVRSGVVVGEGWTQPGGRPHAEAVALMQAGSAAQGSTAYVTLEPCAHHGKSPPCADALVAAGVERVVVALPHDPDKRVCGRGLVVLRRAGIEVVSGVLLAEALDITLGFFSRILRCRPYLSLKLATSLDGRVGMHSALGQRVSFEASRREVLRYRAGADAIIADLEAVEGKDFLFTYNRRQRQPIWIILGSPLPTEVDTRVIEMARETPTWIATNQPLPLDRAKLLERAGVRIISCAGDDGRVDVRHFLGLLATEGLNRVMVEAGTGLATSLLQASLVDELIWFHTSIVLGADATPAFAALKTDCIEQVPRWKRRELRAIGEDTVERLTVEDGFRENLIKAQTATSANVCSSADGRP